MEHELEVVEQWAPPGLAVTAYPVTALPPLLVGSDQDTVTVALPAAPVIAVGAPGTVAGVPEADDEAGPAPTVLWATTVTE